MRKLSFFILKFPLTIERVLKFPLTIERKTKFPLTIERVLKFPLILQRDLISLINYLIGLIKLKNTNGVH